MLVKLTPIPTKNNPKNKYIVVLNVMHGDADKYEDIEITCKNSADFEKKMLAVTNQPLEGSAGGDEAEYKKWCEDNFGEGYIPHDCIYRCTGNLVKVKSIEGFYYNEYGIKFHAELVP